ncbi:nucleoside diphosphate kinase B [Phytophthora infestans T30-4]|uniref:Nucleoside diphosphate kinase n=1 Tax=Phytophthora infestans (strain T30-4) TaxID=403677 RepID=D0ND55_PHYIT|nr:nucleoside diphosphate kinase B [Phytophthora infestans T30-4]EEY56012.1 nucleoside diphosphate kinase B [Phytophthora infestans T30-4]|eukprot:XP_002902842.1 nucleoside diphosphate kinase B [Phytophthora infestans T30-4]
MSRRVASAAKRSATRTFTTQARAASAVKAPVLAVAAAAGVTALALSAAPVAENKAAVQSSTPLGGVPGTSKERTFIAIKPDGVQRGLISEVIGRFEKKGYKLVALKLMTATEARAKAHYADLSERSFFPGLVKYFTSGPIVCMVWEGTDVILTGRKILGATNPNQAAPGTLRGDNCISTGRNLVHGSDGPDSAKHEITMWFTPEEASNYERALDTWIVSDN